MQTLGTALAMQACHVLPAVYCRPSEMLDLALQLRTYQAFLWMQALLMVQCHSLSIDTSMMRWSQ